MKMQAEMTPEILSKLPAPSEVRRRLLWLLEETKVMRRLLRLMERAARERERRLRTAEGGPTGE